MERGSMIETASAVRWCSKQRSSVRLLVPALTFAAVALLRLVAIPGGETAPPNVRASLGQAGGATPRAYLPLTARQANLRPPEPTSAPTAPSPTPRPATATPSPTASPSATPTVPDKPGVPSCAATKGDQGGFRFSLDGGRTLAPNLGTLPPLAYTWDLDIDPRDPRVILELHQGLLYRSGDAGCVFEQVAELDGAWDALTRAPSDPDLIVLTSVFAHALRLSTDGGLTWSTPEDLPDDVVAFAIDPLDAWHWTFAGREGALYDRAGRDARWERRAVTGEVGPVSAAAAASGPFGRWLVGGYHIFRTDDNGLTWQPADKDIAGTVGDPPEPVLSVVAAWLVFAPSDPNVAYAVVNQVGRNQSLRGIWRTADAGEHWERRVADGQPVEPVTAQLTGGTRVFVSPDDPDEALFAFGSYIDGYGTDLFRSSDGLRTLATSHFTGFYEVFALAFGPPGTQVRFLGVSSDVPPRPASGLGGAER